MEESILGNENDKETKERQAKRIREKNSGSEILLDFASSI
jgi:hypothetical protein